MTTLAANKVVKRNRVQLYILVLLFALPPIAAWFFFFNPQLLPEGRTNYGTLIDPPRNLQAVVLETADGVPFDWDELKDLWSMAVVAEGSCSDLCIEQLIKVRQIRRATAANRQRIERLLVIYPDTNGNLEVPELDGLEGTRLLLGNVGNRKGVLELFGLQEDSIENPLFIIDPRIQLMMVHDMSVTTSKQVLQDMERLLKASQNWAEGGRYGHK